MRVAVVTVFKTLAEVNMTLLASSLESFGVLQPSWTRISLGLGFRV